MKRLVVLVFTVLGLTVIAPALADPPPPPSGPAVIGLPTLIQGVPAQRSAYLVKHYPRRPHRPRR
jgi:hypothetical protein